MRRSQFIAGAAVAAAVVGAGLWFAFREEPEAPLDIGTPEAPVVEKMDPVKVRMLEHEPWPYRDFERDFASIRNPSKTDQLDVDPVAERFANEKKAFPTKISLHLKEATVPEVVEAVAAALKPKGLRVFTYETGDLDDVRITIDVDDKMVSEIIDIFRAQTGDRFRYYLTAQGLVLGSERAVQQSQIDEREDVARRREKHDQESPLLATPFRPDFSDAWIGAIHRSIRDQTGVEVVVDYGTWKNGQQLTWHSDPVPLRDALAVICKELHCAYRIRDGRIFLIVP